MRGLYAITPDDLEGAALTALARAALAGGAVVLQYRNKTAGPTQRLSDARALGAACRDSGAVFIVNDDPRLALEADADGVHLGREDEDVGSARALLGRRIIGVSCYDRISLARTAVAAGADYVAFGSVFASTTKPCAVRAPLDLFAQAKPLSVPMVAIGGITLANAARAIDAGADCVAVISDLFSASDVTARARAYAALFTKRTISA